MLVREVVRQCHVVTELLQSRLTFGTGAIRVHEAAYTDQIAWLEFGYGRANFCDAANNFMSRHTRVGGGHGGPLIAGLMEVRVANTAEQNLDLHIAFSWVAPCDGGRNKRRRCTCYGIGFCTVHGFTFA